MRKRKIILDSPAKDVKKQNTGICNTQIKSTTNSEVLSQVGGKPTKMKTSNNLASISHENTFGANNWMKFLESQPLKSKFKQLKNDSHSFAGDNRPNSKFNHRPFTVKPNSIKCHRADERFPAENQLRPMHTANNASAGRVENNKPKLTKQVAIDCEMVGVEVGVNNSILARISIVNANEECVYDKYVKPTEPVLDYRTHVSGIRPKHLENASDFKTVQKEVADILKDRILVGHAINNDLKVLFLTHPKHLIRDTSKFKKFRENRISALKKLAKKYLGVTIQDGEHNSVQDALAAMQLYRMFRKEWEASIHKKRLKKPTKSVAKTKNTLSISLLNSASDT